MYNKIINFLKEQPVLYAESDDAFWDDEHISKYMLASHLDPDCDNAESYPRYSSFDNPSKIIGAACSLPTYPTIPHI